MSRGTKLPNVCPCRHWSCESLPISLKFLHPNSRHRCKQSCFSRFQQQISSLKHWSLQDCISQAAKSDLHETAINIQALKSDLYQAAVCKTQSLISEESLKMQQCMILPALIVFASVDYLLLTNLHSELSELRTTPITCVAIHAPLLHSAWIIFFFWNWKSHASDTCGNRFNKRNMLSESGQEINVGSLTRGRVTWPSICFPDRFIGPDGMAYPKVLFLK